MNEPATPLRNPGPSWGFGFLLWADRRWPRWLFRPPFMAGTWIALAFMPRERAASREYLTVLLGRRPRLIEVWRHFLAFADFLLLKLRTGRGAPLPIVLAPENADAFETLVTSDRPALFGAFHFGCSDLLGFMLSDRGRRVSILRLRIEHATDTRLLHERFGDRVSFLWVNDPANLMFDLKAAMEAGESIAMKCDRLDLSTRNEAFEFLGARRLFPFAIYRFALMFNRPVVFCLALPDATTGGIHVISSPVFTPGAADRDANLAAARRHFQGVLVQLEEQVRRHPYLWFNFLPLNPVAPAIDPAR